MSAPVVSVRPLAEDDDVAAINSGSPLPEQVVWWQQLDAGGGVDMHWRVAEMDGEPVALGAVCPMPVVAGGYGPALLSVLPHARRRGVAGVLRRELEELATGVVPGVVYSVLVGDDEARAALDAWGLTTTGEHRESVLDLTAIDRDDFERRSHADGVEVETPALDTYDDADWHDLHAFVQDRFREAPDSADGGGLLPYEVFRSTVGEPWTMAVARIDGELAGITFVTSRPGDDLACNTFFTGVAPSARGRGVATALKCHQALAMVDAGVERLVTQNMGGNDPILAANRTLGFVYSRSYADVPVLLDTTASTSTS